MPAERFPRAKIQAGAALLGSTVLLAALALFAALGSTARFWADDYCYSALIKQHGWVQGIVTYYLTSGNRFSTVATVGLVDVFSPGAVRFLPLLLIGFWVFAWYFFLQRAARLVSWRIENHWLFFTALMQVYFAILLSPDRLQVIYWRLGILHYTFPLPLLLLQLGWIAGVFCREILPGSGEKRRIVSHPTAWILFLVAFYAAGQCETPAFLQAGVYGFLLLASLFLLRDSRRTQTTALLAFPWLGTLLAIVIIFLSPFNTTRLHDMPAPQNLWLIIPYAFRYGLDFIFYSIRGQLVPYLVFFSASSAASYLVITRGHNRLSRRAAGIGLFLTPLLTLILIALSFAPSAYANLQYPGGRALMPGCFVLLTGLGGMAFFLAAAVEQLFRRAPTGAILRAAAFGLVMAASLYPIYAARNLAAEGQVLAERASRWDGRDQQIRRAISGGALDIQVRQVEVVRSLEDLGPDPNHWINACAAVYYGVRSITASP